MKLDVPEEILKVCTVLTDAGFEAYCVGGCVRDVLLKREPKDWDITTNAVPEQIQMLFTETFYENNFGTVGVVTESADPRYKVVEVTPYRVEGPYTNARHPDHVSWGKTLSDDLKRRDFTVNAIAYDPKNQLLVDEHGGRDDLRRALIKTVGDAHDRFSEDALRMLRAVRLSSELNFVIEATTMNGIAAQSALLGKISYERIRDELTRTLQSSAPMQALFMMQKMNLLTHIIPELEEGIGCAQNQAHSFDVFEHNLRSLQHAADKQWSLEIRLAALLHDIGKPASRRWGEEKKDWTFHGHEVIGARMTEKILKRLHFSSETIKTVTSLVRWHMFFADPEQVSLSAVRRIIRNVGTEHIQELLNLRICDRIGTGRPKEQPFRLRKYMSMVDEALRDPISVSMLKIDGNRLQELGEKPSPRIGWILHALLEEVLDDPSRNTSEHLDKRAKELFVISNDDLKKVGESGKVRREKEDSTAIEELRKARNVT